MAFPFSFSPPLDTVQAVGTQRVGKNKQGVPTPEAPDMTVLTKNVIGVIGVICDQLLTLGLDFSL